VTSTISVSKRDATVHILGIPSEIIPIVNQNTARNRCFSWSKVAQFYTRRFQMTLTLACCARSRVRGVCCGKSHGGSFSSCKMCIYLSLNK
jgi:hypothetical protein